MNCKDIWVLTIQRRDLTVTNNGQMGVRKQRIPLDLWSFHLADGKLPIWRYFTYQRLPCSMAMLDTRRYPGKPVLDAFAKCWSTRNHEVLSNGRVFCLVLKRGTSAYHEQAFWMGKIIINENCQSVRGQATSPSRIQCLSNQWLNSLCLLRIIFFLIPLPPVKSFRIRQDIHK